MNVVGRRSVASLLSIVLNVAWWGIAMATVATIFLAVLPLWFDVSTGEMDIPVAFGLDAPALEASAPGLGIDRAAIRDVRAEGLLTFAPPRGLFLTGVAVALAGSLALLWWIVTQLRAVFRTLREGHPFVPVNATRIRRIAWVLLLGEAARVAVGMAYGYYTVSHFQASGVHFLARPDLNVVVIFEALIILVISEVFRAGTRLDEDQALTI
ncbi:MAG: hypothetical protein ABS36_11890 [Acidobacteria bacterium SCN 69-37]|nr:MAG: hypothetical protein ABS36_11890 [Acidobacteria bacterium SCN 69-37]